MATITEAAGAVLDKVVPPKAAKPDKYVQDRTKRGRERLKELVPKRREAVEFANNNHYAYLNDDATALKQLSTGMSASGEGKPKHRVRLSRDILKPIIKQKVSAATQQIPGYEVNPSTHDPEDISAARLGGKIATAGYERWDIRRATKKVIWNALVTDEGYAMAYWDSNVGPFIETENGSVGLGEICIRTYGGTEVYWEPGVEFEDSRWWAIEHGRPIDVLKKEPGFLGVDLKADGDADQTIGKKRKGTNLVIVTEYLERPSKDHPNGRYLTMAGGRTIFPEEDYPLKNTKGEVIDEPCIHRLSYDIDPSSDHDKGLVRGLIDSVRAYDQSLNKAAEWVNSALAPQLLAPEGSLLAPLTDEPNEVIYYSTLPGMDPPKWKQTPPIPPELFEVADRSQNEIIAISSSTDIPSQLSSAQAIQSYIEQQQVAWQDFLTDLAGFHSALMRDCLTLVQLYYTEERLIQYRGRTGWENIPDFLGADLRGQTDVRVLPGSLGPKTRQQVEQRIMNINQMFPGYFPPEVLISAMDGGTAEGLVEGYEEDVARANLVIQQIRTGVFWDLPPRPVFPGENAPDPNLPPDPMTGQPPQLAEVPGWMPRPFDGVPVHKAVLESWMKSDDWASLDPESQKATMVYYSALLGLEQEKAARDAALQSQMAAQQGMNNAAAPPAKPMPSMPTAGGTPSPAAA